MNTNRNCTKCGNPDFEAGEVRTTGGFWSKIFDIQSRHFISVSCTMCGFTELYKKSGNRTLENIFDLFTT